MFIRNNPELFDVAETDEDVNKIVKELSAIRNSHKNGTAGQSERMRKNEQWKKIDTAREVCKKI